MRKGCAKGRRPSQSAYLPPRPPRLLCVLCAIIFGFFDERPIPRVNSTSIRSNRDHGGGDLALVRGRGGLGSSRRSKAELAVAVGHRCDVERRRRWRCSKAEELEDLPLRRAGAEAFGSDQQDPRRPALRERPQTLVVVIDIAPDHGELGRIGIAGKTEKSCSGGGEPPMGGVEHQRKALREKLEAPEVKTELHVERRPVEQ